MEENDMLLNEQAEGAQPEAETPVPPETKPKEVPIPGAATPEELKAYYGNFRYAWGSFLKFFGFSSKTHRASKKRAKLVADIATYVVLIVGAFFMVYPFWWMIAASFTVTDMGGGGSLQYIDKLIWWPIGKEASTWTASYNDKAVGAFYNYKFFFTTAFENTKQINVTYWRALLNNLIYSVVPVVVGVITSASAAFAFAKINWIGRDVVFMFLLAAIMIPGPSVMITQYVMYQDMNWADNGLVLIIPGMFGSIMTAFFIRQFLFGMPTSIIEAAKIDGAGYFRIFCQFILPLAMPAIMAQGLLSFMGCWNNYMGSYIFISAGSSMINLPHAMFLINATLENNQGPNIAGAVMCVLPVMILFACFQKLIIGSLMLTGSKE